MWMQIDPHLLLFTLLPALLTGDAMTIDTTVAKRVAAQCIYLAGPGVLVSSCLTGLFLWQFLGHWPFMLCMTMGAILAATDPVAVVGLLKELGASPTLTVQIQGESLLNDGTAIVLFKVTYDMLCGTEYDFKGILILFVYMVVCSWFLGMIIGGVFSSWISSASNRLEHESSLIQIALTICCAYCSFIFAEGIIGISGVLSTVAASLMLADNIWPKIVSQEAMHEVWHMLEYIGNTLIFFLAGALTGKTMTKIDPMDFLNLLVLYLVLMVIRGSVIFLSRPILSWLSPDRTPVTLEDAMVMTWGGLRGAVGLALAIQVSSDRAGGMLEQKEADRVMFFTGGIAAMTLVINATTCPKLMAILGLTATTESKQRMMLIIHSRLEEQAMGHSSKVTGIIDSLLANVKHHIQHECEVVKSPSASSKTSAGFKDSLKHHESQHGGEPFLAPENVLANFERAKEAFCTVSEHCKELLGWSSEQPLLKDEDKMVAMVRGGCAEFSMVRSVNESYLALLRSEYWSHIRRGEFVDGTRCAEILLSSSTAAFQFAGQGLLDYKQVQSQLGIAAAAGNDHPKADRTWSTFGLSNEKGSFFSKLVHSTAFKFFMVLVIIINAVFIFVEGSSNSDQAVMFLVIDGVFMLIYIFEFILKVSVLRLKYFFDGWNALDFMCVVLGLFGIAMQIAVELGSLDEDSVSSEMQLMRLNRIFKLMRLMRIVVVVKFARTVSAKFKGKVVSEELAVQLENIFTLKAFVQAHIATQSNLLRFIGRTEDAETRFDQCEEARCILESWTQVYWALVHGAAEIEKVEDSAPWILGGMSVLHESSEIVEELTEFVVSAAKAGILKEREAEAITHPMQEHLRKTNMVFADCHAGIHRTSLQKAYDSGFTRSVSTGSDDTCGVCGVDEPGLSCVVNFALEDELGVDEVSVQIPVESQDSKLPTSI
jgi:NhaP-type Na+/H+ or K+/H+ antiporter